MAVSTQVYILAVSVTLSILAILVCFARGLWACRLARKGLYKRDFEKLTDESNALCVETARFHRSVAEDDCLDASVKTACMEIVKEVEDYDAAVQIGLAAWEDMMRPAERHSDVEIGKDDDMKARRKLGNRHRRYAIEAMRKRCMEGIEKRKRLSLQMQWILTEVVSRDIWSMLDTMSGALPVSSSHADCQESPSSLNNFSAFHVHKKLDQKHPSLQHTRTTHKGSITNEKYCNFTHLSPVKNATPKTVGSTTRGQEEQTSDDLAKSYFSEDDVD